MSRLLKSWATPPASRPTASIFLRLNQLVLKRPALGCAARDAVLQFPVDAADFLFGGAALVNLGSQSAVDPLEL